MARSRRSNRALTLSGALAASLFAPHGVSRASSPLEATAAPLPSPAGSAEDASAYSACAAPSVTSLHGVDDGTDPGVPGCAPGDGWSRLVEREEAAARRCDTAGRAVSLARVLSGALPLDAPTVAHVRDVFRAGQVRGRRPDAFGLVGDSLSMDRNFMRPFASPSLALPPEVAGALAEPRSPGKTLVDVLRDARTDDDTIAPDSFVAPRAARVGAMAPWAVTARGPERQDPIDDMIDRVSPAYAVILYGVNDALWQTDSLARLERDEDAAMSAIVDALEARGVIPILTTVPKHMREAGWPDCPAAKPGQAPTGGANERFAAQATGLSAGVAALACRRHLPLIDLRWSLDPLLDHGVGPDGVHLSAHPRGGGVLDGAGLECGYNVRNLVTLRELALVVDAATRGVW